jgi:hypothetical protein
MSPSKEPKKRWRCAAATLTASGMGAAAWSVSPRTRPPFTTTHADQPDRCPRRRGLFCGGALMTARVAVTYGQGVARMDAPSPPFEGCSASFACGIPPSGGVDCAPYPRTCTCVDERGAYRVCCPGRSNSLPAHGPHSSAARLPQHHFA